jgi:CDP-diacylglycerol---serine O-phosphatidyltransferase
MLLKGSWHCLLPFIFVSTMRRHIPNALTVGNLLAGMLGIYCALVVGDLFAAAWCIFLAGLLDVLDGAVARALGVAGGIGKDLDSLADAVPSFIMMRVLQDAESPLIISYPFLAFLPWVLAVCGVVRLARFNNDPGQSVQFRGIPIPAAAIAISGFGIQSANFFPAEAGFVLHPWVVLAASFVIAYLMVSPFPMLSFKIPFRPALWYWLAILVLPLCLLVWVHGAITFAIIMAYFLVSQLYFKNHPAQ